jgi:2-polyprenyl-3-methyl-5-hydroxy-6-metoxy-1,4-benzoquinol methylase
MSAVPATPAALSRLARELVPASPMGLRARQVYRPFICPLHRLTGLVPEGSTVLDVGCGGGLWLFLLLALGRVRRGIGFDADSRAVAFAAQSPALARAGGLLEVRHVPHDSPWPEGEFDVVSMIDVLHHVPAAAQREVLEQAVARVRRGGRLIYKDVGPIPAWRALASRVHDLVVARQLIHIRPPAEVEGWARETGLGVLHRESIPQLWYGHELLVFHRGEEEGRSGP